MQILTKPIKEVVARIAEMTHENIRIIQMQVTKYARKCAQEDADKYAGWNTGGVAIVPNTNPARSANWQIQLFNDEEGEPENAVEIFRPKSKPATSELTPTGEQLVIPGAEREQTNVQGSLWS